MSRSKNTPYVPREDRYWVPMEHDAPGQWAGIKELRRMHNRKTRHSFRNKVRSTKHWEELDDLPDYEDVRKRNQAKWDY